MDTAIMVFCQRTIALLTTGLQRKYPERIEVICETRHKYIGQERLHVCSSTASYLLFSAPCTK